MSSLSSSQVNGELCWYNPASQISHFNINESYINNSMCFFLFFLANYHPILVITAWQTRSNLGLRQAPQVSPPPLKQTALAAVNHLFSPDLSRHSSPSFPDISNLTLVRLRPHRLWFLFPSISCHLRAAHLNLKAPRGLSAWLCRALCCPDLDNMWLF